MKLFIFIIFITGCAQKYSLPVVQNSMTKEERTLVTEFEKTCDREVIKYSEYLKECQGKLTEFKNVPNRTRFFDDKIRFLEKNITFKRELPSLERQRFVSKLIRQCNNNRSWIYYSYFGSRITNTSSKFKTKEDCEVARIRAEKSEKKTDFIKECRSVYQGSKVVADLYSGSYLHGNSEVKRLFATKKSCNEYLEKKKPIENCKAVKQVICEGEKINSVVVY